MKMEKIKTTSGYFFILAVITPLIADGVVEDVTHFNKLKDIKEKIFKDYDKLIRPINDTRTTHVKLRIFPRYIMDVDEEKSLFTLDCFLAMNWLDTRLTWSNDTNIEWIQIPHDTIWKPDISLWNSHMGILNSTSAVMANIRYDGKVWWFPPAKTATFCVTSDLDDVVCSLGIGSWTHYSYEINLDTTRDGGIYMGLFNNVNPSWELKEDEVSVVRRIHNYSEEVSFVSLQVSFPLKRRSSPQLHLVRAPCIMATVLMLALLCVPPQHYYARVLFGAFLFLVLNVLMLYASATAKTPQTAKNAVALVRSTSVVLTIFLAMQVVISRLCCCTGPSRPNGTLVKWLSTPIVGRVLFWKRDNSADTILTKEGDETSEPSAAVEWTLVASAIDNLLFVVFVPTVSFLLLVD